MKKIGHSEWLRLIFVLLIFSSNGFFARGRDTSSCLEMSGKILKLKTHVSNSYTVNLILKNTIIETKIIKGNNEFKFNLKKNEVYIIRLSKEGFVPREISVDTKLAEEQDGFYKFAFDTELISEEEMPKLNKDALKLPIAKIAFDSKKRWFTHNEAYTKEVKKCIYKNAERNSVKILE